MMFPFYVSGRSFRNGERAHVPVTRLLRPGEHQPHRSWFHGHGPWSEKRVGGVCTAAEAGRQDGLTCLPGGLANHVAVRAGQHCGVTRPG